MKFITLCFISIFYSFEVELVFCDVRNLYCPFKEPVISPTDYNLVYVKYGDNVIIPCCQKYSESKTKSWFKKDRFMKEAEVDLNNDASKISANYDFNIENFTENDSGAYYCKDTIPDSLDSNYYYLIDVVIESQTTIFGSRKGYIQYLEKFFHPITEYFDNYQKNDELLQLYEQTGLTLSVNLRFDEWSACDGCKKEKRRIGHCHLEPRINRSDLCKQQCEIYQFALSVDCRATWTLNRILPKVSEKVKQVPDFGRIIKCVGVCSAVELPGIDVHNKFKLQYVPIGTTLQLICQDYSLRRRCHWTKNKITLNSYAYDPYSKVSVNEFAVLLIKDATTAENGEYICFLDGELVTEYKVIAYEDASEKNALWWRHMKYLLYIILLCFIILAAGLVIGTIQRNSYQQIDVKEAVENLLRRKFDHEKIEPPDVSK